MTRALCAAALLATFGATPVAAKERPTVAVAPFLGASQSADEYGWLSGALSESLSARLLASGAANVLSQKQWSAVLRERDIEARAVRGRDDAEAIARQLGASQYIVGNIQARWPDVTLSARRFAVRGPAPAGADEPMAVATVSGRLEDLVKLEKKLAKAILGKDFKKGATANVVPKNAYAWRAWARCQENLALQSIGPGAHIWLPDPVIEGALTDCQAATKLDKKFVEASSFEALATFLLSLNKPEADAKKMSAAAMKKSKAALKKRKEPGWPDLIEFFIKGRSGNAAGANKVLAKAIKKRPGFLHARTTLGESLAAGGDLKGAEAVFQASLKDAPNQPWVRIQLSKIQSKQGDVTGAVATVDEALKSAPDDAVMLMERASRLIDGEKWKEAETDLRRAMKQDPRLAAAYVRLGYVYLQTGQLALAEPILQKALYEADRDSERRVKGYAHFDLAKLYARKKNKKKAMVELGRAVQAGTLTRARMEDDPDLAAFKDDAEFKKLLPGGPTAMTNGDAPKAKKDDKPAKKTDAKPDDGKAAEPKDKKDAPGAAKAPAAPKGG